MEKLGDIPLGEKLGVTLHGGEAGDISQGEEAGSHPSGRRQETPVSGEKLGNILCGGEAGRHPSSERRSPSVLPGLRGSLGWALLYLEA